MWQNVKGYFHFYTIFKQTQHVLRQFGFFLLPTFEKSIYLPIVFKNQFETNQRKALKFELLKVVQKLYLLFEDKIVPILKFCHSYVYDY